MFIKASPTENAVMNHSPHICHPPCKFRFTEKQGQYLAFIHAYCCIMGKPPAEVDMQRHFRVTPPTVHQMVLTLERAGLITRKPRTPRSIQLLVAPENLPVLR
jgi:DNA-binding MarR family transcriptional regulator